MPQLNEEMTPEEISTITGYQQEEEKESFDSDDLLDQEDLIEENDPTQNPWVRFGFIGTFLFILLGLGGIVLFVLSSANFTRVKNTEDNSTQNLAVVQNTEELSQLKAELALRDQQLEESPPPQIQKIEPKPQKIVSQPRPLPVVRQQPDRPVVRPKPLPHKVTPQKQVDPQKRWQELSQIGSSKSNGKSQELPLVVNQPQVTPNQNLIASNQLIISDQSSLPPQKASAILEGGIAVPARQIGFQSLTVPIVLSEPLRDRRDKEAIPAGAVIIAEVKNNGSVMEITPQTISFEQDNQYYELNLNQGSMIVTGSQGPVIASIQTIGADGAGLSLSQMSQLAALTGALGNSVQDFSLIFSALGMGRRTYSRTNTVQLYTVPQGTEVVVRIVRNFPIDFPADDHNSEFTSPQAPVQTAYKPEEDNFEYEFEEQYQQELDFDRLKNSDQQQELDFDY